MKIQRSLLCLAAACAPALLRAEGAFDYAPAERAIEIAYVQTDPGALAAAVAPVEAALARDPRDPALLYLRAFGHFAATSSERRHGDKAAEQKDLEAAVPLLERVRGTPWKAEAQALEGDILGMLIGLKGGMAGMTLGPKSAQLIGEAAAAAPASPRVLLFQGLNLLNTPKTWGGDPDKGREALRKAAALFEGAQPEAGPHWGRADALVWLGFAEKRLGDREAARAAWRQALAVEPGYGWVRYSLLPGLDRK